MSTTETVKFPVSEARGWFVTKFFETGEGGPITILDSGAPGALLDAVREAHEDEGPNEWRWETFAALWNEILDQRTHDGELHDSELVDSVLDIYVEDQAEWIRSVPSRADYVREVLEDGWSPDGFWELLTAAQAAAVWRILEHVQGAIHDLVDFGGES